MQLCITNVTNTQDDENKKQRRPNRRLIATRQYNATNYEIIELYYINLKKIIRPALG